jgi:hypothetical protein
MTALSPSQDRPAEAPVAVIPAQRSASPGEAPLPQPAVLPRPRPAAVWSVVTGMAVGAVGTMAAVAIAGAPAVVPAPVVTTPRTPEPRIAFAGTVSVPGREMTSFGDGTWQVGVDVGSGTYTTTGGSACRHALKPAATGAAIVESVSPGPDTVVLTDDSGWFETAGCTTWRQAG